MWQDPTDSSLCGGALRDNTNNGCNFLCLLNLSLLLYFRFLFSSFHITDKILVIFAFFSAKFLDISEARF